MQEFDFIQASMVFIIIALWITVAALYLRGRALARVISRMLIEHPSGDVRDSWRERNFSERYFVTMWPFWATIVKPASKR